jgi:hypothetical protein
MKSGTLFRPTIESLKQALKSIVLPRKVPGNGIDLVIKGSGKLIQDRSSFDIC